MNAKTKRPKRQPLPSIERQSVHWWYRDSTDEWVLELDVIAADRCVNVRFVGKTKAEAMGELEGRLT